MQTMTIALAAFAAGILILATFVAAEIWTAIKGKAAHAWRSRRRRPPRPRRLNLMRLPNELVITFRFAAPLAPEHAPE